MFVIVACLVLTVAVIVLIAIADWIDRKRF